MVKNEVTIELKDLIFKFYVGQAKEVDFILQGAIKGFYSGVKVTCLDLHFAVK